MTWILNIIPTPYRLAVFAILAIFVFLAGWHAHTIYDGYKEQKKQNEAILAHTKAETDANDRSAALEVKLADSRKQIDNLKGRLNAETRNIGYRCPIPSAGLSIRHDAIAGTTSR